MIHPVIDGVKIKAPDAVILSRLIGINRKDRLKAVLYNEKLSAAADVFLLVPPASVPHMLLNVF